MNMMNNLLNSHKKLLNNTENFDVVLSSRVMLSRNLDGYNFPGKMDLRAKKETREEILEAFKQLPIESQFSILYMDNLQPINMRQIIEKNVECEELLPNEEEPVITNSDGSIVASLNQGDHLKLSCTFLGLSFIVNAGGDMQIAGDRFGRPWRLGIQNPFAPGVIASLELRGNYSLFTSGNYHRQYRRGERLTHHIIDPRSGESSRGQSSATVLVGDPVLADVAATVLMIDEIHKNGNLALSLGVTDFLLVSESRQLMASRSFYDKLKIDAPWPVKIVN